LNALQAIILAYNRFNDVIALELLAVTLELNIQHSARRNESIQKFSRYEDDALLDVSIHRTISANLSSISSSDVAQQDVHNQ